MSLPLFCGTQHSHNKRSKRSLWTFSFCPHRRRTQTIKETKRTINNVDEFLFQILPRLFFWCFPPRYFFFINIKRRVLGAAMERAGADPLSVLSATRCAKFDPNTWGKKKRGERRIYADGMSRGQICPQVFDHLNCTKKLPGLKKGSITNQGIRYL